MISKMDSTTKSPIKLSRKIWMDVLRFGSLAQLQKLQKAGILRLTQPIKSESKSEVHEESMFLA